MRTLIKILLTFITFIIVTIIYIFNSPKPAAWIVHQLFKASPAIAPNHYKDILKSVTIKSDITYPSNYLNNSLDIISPKNNTRILPTIIWVHGGAYVGGDKSDVTKYAVQIAAQGYHVVTLNYELAPAAQYPTPLHQLEEVYEFVKSHANNYDFDTERLYFAGDSAGAQIAAQFTAIQTNADYAKQLHMKQIVPQHNIKGVLLYCGPYNIQHLSHMSDIKLVAFLLNKVGWAYIGERDWVNSKTAKLASPIDYVTIDFPPAFITDGKEMSFEAHALELVERLQHLGVRVDSKFYDAALPHEYQFMMVTPEATETFLATIQFLQETSTP